MPFPAPHEHLPESLVQKLKVFRERLWKYKIIQGLILTGSFLFLSWLLLFVSDRLWDTPRILRFFFFIIGVVPLFSILPLTLYRWVWRYRSQAQLARLIARRYPAVGDRILGIIELDYNDQPHTSYSESLKKAAISQVSDEAGKLDLNEAIPRSNFRIFPFFALALAFLMLLLTLIMPAASINTLSRWALPFGDKPRYTFTRLLDIPGSLFVPLGESFAFTIEIDPSSKRTVQEIKAGFPPAPLVISKVIREEDGLERSVFHFPGIYEQKNMKIQAGDSRYNVLVIPRPRPNIAELSMYVEFPEYTGLEPAQMPVRTGSINLLRGSLGKLKAKATQEIETAELVVDGDKIPLEIRDDTVLFPAITVDQSLEINFAWKDTKGIESPALFKVRVEPVEDRLPDVYLQTSSKDIFILERESIELEAIASDDYGLAELTLEWQGPAGTARKVLVQGEQTLKRMNSAFLFQPEAMGLTPQTVTVQALAKDFHPEHDYKRSAPVTIHILTKMEHAQMIRSALDKTVRDLEEISQVEQLLVDETARLHQLKPDKLLLEENKKSLRDVQDSEEANAGRIQAVIEEMEDLFLKALRNDEIEADAMKPFREAADLLKELPGSSLKDAKEALDQASRPNNTPEKTTEELKNSRIQQQKTLDTINEALGLLNQSSSNMEAGTFVARLSKLAEQEKEIINTIHSQLKDTIGLSIDKILPSQKRKSEEASSLQKSVIKDLTWIGEDLNGFFLRSQNPVHSQLANAISSLLLHQGIENLPKLIVNNQGAISLDETHYLYNLILEWAGTIESAKKDQTREAAGGEGSDDHSMSESDFDFMLKVMRMIQAQQDIRERTRSLEEERRLLAPADSSILEQPERELPYAEEE